MMTVHEVSKLTGLSVRTLQYYDTIGLLPPSAYSPAGYRLYDGTALERLQQIMLFRELAFPLKEIAAILDAPDFDRNRALEQQIEMLEMQKEHLENLIKFARGIKSLGVKYMDYTAFDKTKLEEYAKQAKAQWGNTPEYCESQKKAANRSPEQQEQLMQDFMRLFTEFGGLRGEAPESEAVQHQVQRLQEFITAHFYHCTNDILRGLGTMYAAGGEFTQNIDLAGGEGTAAFTSQAIGIYCDRCAKSGG